MIKLFSWFKDYIVYVVLLTNNCEWFMILLKIPLIDCNVKIIQFIFKKSNNLMLTDQIWKKNRK